MIVIIWRFSFYTSLFFMIRRRHGIIRVINNDKVTGNHRKLGNVRTISTHPPAYHVCRRLRFPSGHEITAQFEYAAFATLFSTRV